MLVPGTCCPALQQRGGQKNALDLQKCSPTQVTYGTLNRKLLDPGKPGKYQKTNKQTNTELHCFSQFPALDVHPADPKDKEGAQGCPCRAPSLLGHSDAHARCAQTSAHIGSLSTHPAEVTGVVLQFCPNCSLVGI